MGDFTPELAQARALLSDIVAHARAFETARLAFIPAVIDRSTTHTVVWRSEETIGIVRFIDSLEHHLSVFDEMAQSDVPPRDNPLPVALGLANSWKCFVLATAPVPAVRMAAKVEPPWDGKGKKPQPQQDPRRPGPVRPREAFVDVVARGGAEWIRICSKKTSQLMAEFHEADSYINSDYDSDDADEDAAAGCGSAGVAAQRASGRSSGSSTPSGIENSITRLVDELLSLAADVERPPGTAPPTLTLRMTRIEEHPPGGHPDPRIPETFAAVRGRGVRLVFGDLSDVPVAALPTTADPPRSVRPTRRVNLDPTALMGLCSDLLHFPVPASAAEAEARFYRPAELVGAAGQSQNSRELVRALTEEMEAPVIEQIRDALADVLDGDEKVELWATREAVTYLQETISSEDIIGLGEEQRRMRRLTGLEQGDFWEGSRYAGKAGVLADMRLHVFDEPETYPPYLQHLLAKDSAAAASHTNGHENGGSTFSDPTRASPAGSLTVPGHTILAAPLCAEGMTSFHSSTATLCATFLEEYAAHLAHPTRASAAALPSFLTPRRLPSPRVARITVPFNLVALHALARGAAEGMTTLSMGHVVFRELFAQPRWRAKGWTQSNYACEDARAEPGAPVSAVAWILPYRSLGEAKRIKFASGDYSFPEFVQRVPKNASGEPTPRSGSPSTEHEREA